jgi:hypothetical protein
VQVESAVLWRESGTSLNAAIYQTFPNSLWMFVSAQIYFGGTNSVPIASKRNQILLKPREFPCASATGFPVVSQHVIPALRFR